MPAEIVLSKSVAPPAWALLQRHLLTAMSRAAVTFVERYTRPDGTLVWREEWPGMDGSDDAYESFFNFPLLYALGGASEVDALARREWEAITRQFTGYGQVWREFDAYYDWMHHGESSLLFYYFGLANPADSRMRARAERFAAMYTGDDPAAPNYDRARRLMRSPINGSRGPRFQNTAEDWVTHREILAHYPPPFDDIPGIPAGSPTANWNDDGIFAEILALLNRRMMRGDVPLNLTATSLIANAYLYTGDDTYAEWVRDYVSAWRERAARNHGLLPDNVGPHDVIGECMDGRWWGGYYGWRWPHGFMTLIEPATIAASNALLLTGDSAHLDLARNLLDRIYAAGHAEDGRYCIPHRHGDHGWYDFRPIHASGGNAAAGAAYPVYLWFLSRDPADAERVERWRGPDDWTEVIDHRGKGDNLHAHNWYHFVTGNAPGYPEKILQANYAEVRRRMAAIHAESTDPETWDVHHWQDRNPVVCEGLVQSMLGAPQTIYHGGLLHASVRYFDAERRRPGVPEDVAALVHRVDAGGIDVTLVNISPLCERRVIVQAGAFAEHRFETARVGAEETEIDGPWVEVTLPPGCGGDVRLTLRRHCAEPTYRGPRM